VYSVPDCATRKLDEFGFVCFAKFFYGVKIAYGAFGAVVALRCPMYLH